MSTDYNLDSFNSVTINFKIISYAICNKCVVMSNSELVAGKKTPHTKGINI